MITILIIIVVLIEYIEFSVQCTFRVVCWKN